MRIKEPGFSQKTGFFAVVEINNRLGRVFQLAVSYKIGDSEALLPSADRRQGSEQWELLRGYQPTQTISSHRYSL